MLRVLFVMYLISTWLLVDAPLGLLLFLVGAGGHASLQFAKMRTTVRQREARRRLNGQRHAPRDIAQPVHDVLILGSELVAGPELARIIGRQQLGDMPPGSRAALATGFARSGRHFIL